MIFEPFERFSPSEFRVKFAASRWEREGACTRAAAASLLRGAGFVRRGRSRRGR